MPWNIPLSLELVGVCGGPDIQPIGRGSASSPLDAAVAAGRACTRLPARDSLLRAGAGQCCVESLGEVMSLYTGLEQAMLNRGRRTRQKILRSTYHGTACSGRRRLAPFSLQGPRRPQSHDCSLSAIDPFRPGHVSTSVSASHS